MTGPDKPPPAAPETPRSGAADQASSRVARRGFVLGAVAVLALGGFAYGRWYNVGASLEGGGALDVAEAHRAALSGDVILIDIRRPDEWRRTGVPEGAVALDMRRSDFIEALLAQTQGARDVPVALICARGVRSRGLGQRLAGAGFERVLDVPEGMLGSGAGAGWLARGLPVVAYTG